MSDPPPELLAVDIGNTHTDWALFRGATLLERGRGPTRPEGDEPSGWEVGLSRAPRGLPVVACTVVPEIEDLLSRAATAHGRTCHFLDHHSPLPFPLRYRLPGELGPDRLANAIGAGLHADPPYVVVDLGTALTVDGVTRTGGYEGGAIAPGPAIIADYLHERTARLPLLDLARARQATGIGRTTAEAMEIGCSVGMAGMAEALTAEVRRALARIDGEEPVVLLTGGGHAWVRGTSVGEWPFYPDLTLEGLRSWATRFPLHPEAPHTDDGRIPTR